MTEEQQRVETPPMTTNPTDLAAEGLNPCPFCGGEAKALEEGERWHVACFNIKCWCDFGAAWDRDAMPDHAFDTAEEAIAAWNTRTTPPEPQGDEVARLREAWQRVSDQLDHIEGGMHADLEDAASNMWDVIGESQ